MVSDANNLASEELIYFVLFAYCDSLSYEEVASDDFWIKVMDEENHSIGKNNIWKLTNLSNSKKLIVVKTEYKPNG